MIPLKDRNPTHRFPVVTVSLIAMNITAWLYQESLGEGKWEQPAIVVLGLWFALQFLNGMVSIGMGTADMGGVS